MPRVREEGARGGFGEVAGAGRVTLSVTEQNELKPQAVASGPARHSSPIETPLQQPHSVALSIAAGPPSNLVPSSVEPGANIVSAR
jgi:hypothetical protein